MNLENYSIIELKALLRRVGMKSSGTKAELLQRLQTVKENVVVEAVKEVVQEVEDDQDDDAEDAEHLRDEVGELRGMVGQLSEEVVALRTSVSENASPIMNASDDVVNSQFVTSMITTCAAMPPFCTTSTNTMPRCTTQDQINQVVQPVTMYPGLYPTTVGQNGFLSSPQPLDLQQHNVNVQQQYSTNQKHYIPVQQQHNVAQQH